MLGAERAEDFKRLTSQLLTQLSPRMRQLQQFSPLRVMVNSLTSAITSTQKQRSNALRLP